MPAPISLDAVRVPCPQCGKPIHPIAGRCRHCHADVVGRVARGPVPPPRRPRARQGFVTALVLAVVLAGVAYGGQLALAG